MHERHDKFKNRGSLTQQTDPADLTYPVSSDVVSAAVGLPEAAAAVTDRPTRRSLYFFALHLRRWTAPPTRATSAFA